MTDQTREANKTAETIVTNLKELNTGHGRRRSRSKIAKFRIKPPKSRSSKAATNAKLKGENK